MKKFLIIVSASLLFAACSNSNTVNVPKNDSSNGVAAPFPHDTASDMRDSAMHPDTAVQHRY